MVLESQWGVWVAEEEIGSSNSRLQNKTPQTQV